MKKMMKVAAVALVALPSVAFAGSPAPVVVESDPFVETATGTSGSMGGGAGLAIAAGLALAVAVAASDGS